MEMTFFAALAIILSIIGLISAIMETKRAIVTEMRTMKYEIMRIWSHIDTMADRINPPIDETLERLAALEDRLMLLEGDGK